MTHKLIRTAFSSLVFLVSFGCLSQQPTIVNTAKFLPPKEIVQVELIERQFSAFQTTQGYKALRTIRKKEVGKKLEVFVEASNSWGGGYGAYLFIKTNRDAKYYYLAKDGIHFRKIEFRQFDAVIESSGGLDEIFELMSTPSHPGCFDANYYRLTVIDPTRVRIAYYYCTEPPLIINVFRLIESMSS